MFSTKRKSASKGFDSAKRAKAVIEHASVIQPRIPDQIPLSNLLQKLHEHQDRVTPKPGNVVHWFRSDLRLKDNRALHAASQKARENGKSLIALYVVSPQVNLSCCI
jgi:DNA photolyase